MYLVRVLNNDKLPIAASTVARIFNCDQSTVLRMVQDGRLIPIGKLEGSKGAYLFDPDEIERIASESETRVVVAKTAKAAG